MTERTIADALTGGDCTTIADALDLAVAAIPRAHATRPLRAKLETFAAEYHRAARLWNRGAEYGLDPEVRGVGGIERGEWVMTGSGCAQLRRITETGVELILDGKPVWENISTRTTPYVVVNEGEGF